jgi:prepilin-type N-terminal cleavage/methylation domain-containing protein
MDRNSTARSGGVHGASKQNHALSLTELIVVLGIIAILAALFLPAYRSAGPAARRTQCLNNIRNIALALRNYEEEYHVLPPAYTVDARGNRLHSWRTLILPYLDQKSLYKRIDLSKPWYDPANAKIGETALSIYSCPEAHRPESQCPENCTTYLAVVTPDSCLRAGKSRALSEITSPGKTLMVIEVDSKHAVPWMSADDASEELWLSFGPKSDLPHAGGSLAAFVDCTARFLPADLPANDRRAMISITEKKK